MFKREEDDGVGTVVPKCSRPDCDAQVVRPGKSQCRGEWTDECGDFGSEPHPLDVVAARLDDLEDRLTGLEAKQ
jgi:hypothetical protein